MAFAKAVGHALESFQQNAKMIWFFSVPLVLALPLSFLLPNYISGGAIFLRIGSIKADLGLYEALFIAMVFLAALMLFSIAITAINIVVKSQRAITRITHNDIAAVESHTLYVFMVFLLAFVFSLAINLLLYDSGLTPTLGALATLIIYSAVMFAPQAIVLEDSGVVNALKKSVSTMLSQPLNTILFFALAAVLLLVNAWIFLMLSQSMPILKFFSIIVNGMLILPFLELVKTQMFLGKYTLL